MGGLSIVLRHSRTVSSRFAALRFYFFFGPCLELLQDQTLNLPSRPLPGFQPFHLIGSRFSGKNILFLLFSTHLPAYHVQQQPFSVPRYDDPERSGAEKCEREEERNGNEMQYISCCAAHVRTRRRARGKQKKAKEKRKKINSFFPPAFLALRYR